MCIPQYTSTLYSTSTSLKECYFLYSVVNGNFQHAWSFKRRGPCDYASTLSEFRRLLCERRGGVGNMVRVRLRVPQTFGLVLPPLFVLIHVFHPLGAGGCGCQRRGGRSPVALGGHQRPKGSRDLPLETGAVFYARRATIQ